MKGSNEAVSLRAAAMFQLAALRQEIEKKYPGYLDENIKMNTMVLIFTGLRVLYGIFYLGITILYGLPIMRALLIILSAFIFYLWYSLMLKAGKGIAVLMLCIRGYSVVTGGVSILTMSYWLSFSLIFTLTTACIMEFCEAVFCIYILFNKTAATTIRLNKELNEKLRQGVSKGSLERMAEYKNPYSGDVISTDEAPEPGMENVKSQGKTPGGDGHDLTERPDEKDEPEK